MKYSLFYGDQGIHERWYRYAALTHKVDKKVLTTEQLLAKSVLESWPTYWGARKCTALN